MGCAPASRNSRGGKPPWLRVKAPQGPRFAEMGRILRSRGLHTVCQEALCPNMGRCWGSGRATLLILGDVCTRSCGFCNVGCGRPAAPDRAEPKRVAEAVRAMGLQDVVITSVTRDDLDDGGAGIWAETVRQVRRAAPAVRVEALVPDFGGSIRALEAVIASGPAVFGHNLETVPSLYAAVRPQADYERSLDVLRRAAAHGLPAKTGLMVGLGESREQILALMRDARSAGCSIFFAGQYLQPTRKHVPVRRYLPPGEFEELRTQGLNMGFRVVVAGPLVRTSYHSEEQTAYLNSAGRQVFADKPPRL